MKVTFVNLCQQRTKLFCMQSKRPLWPKRHAIIIIDSALYLFTISSPDMDMHVYSTVQQSQ